MNDLHTLCRTCGTTVNEEVDVKLFEELNYPLVTILEDITDMWIENDSILPEYICIECKAMLDQIVEFRASCLSTHKQLIEAIKRDINISKNQNISNEASSIIDCEERENLYLNNSEHCNDSSSLSIIESDCDNPPEETPSTFLRKGPSYKQKSTKKRNRINKTWICEQCGGEFKCSTFFKLHLLRHTDKKEFECDVCKKRYYTRNEMLRHKILHTNARPYACRYCGKTFRGTSSKAVHERTHTNERPFPCQYCEKAFTSTSIRKAHEKMHLNNRKYHCEPCDKWFLRSSHLLLHQRSKIHKSKLASNS